VEVAMEMKIQLHENATTDTLFLKPDTIQIAAISSVCPKQGDNENNKMRTQDIVSRI
jgi:hypothetical protein